MTAHQLHDNAVRAREMPHSGAVVPETGLEDLEARIERLFARLRMAVVFGGDKSVNGAVINHTVNPRINTCLWVYWSPDDKPRYR